MTIETLGIDIAKNVFQLHGVNRGGRAVFKRRVMRDQLLEVVSRIDRCTIAVEACTGAFYWARKFEGLGHQVRIISPQYVKPFVRRQKNDGNDAEAICTAARQPHIPFVPKKTIEQQDIQALHRARQRMVNTGPQSSARSGGYTRSWVPDGEEHYASATPGSRDPCRYDE